MYVQEAEVGGLQIEMGPVLIASTERIHPHPPRPDYRLQAPRKQDPRRGMFRKTIGFQQRAHAPLNMSFFRAFSSEA